MGLALAIAILGCAMPEPPRRGRLVVDGDGADDSGPSEDDAGAPFDAGSNPDAAPRDDALGAFELVGHSDLGARGMNDSLALAGDYAYVGSLTDGERHPNAGVLVVDIADPAAPTLVGAIDEGTRGISSRELRAVPDLGLLYVLEIQCDPEMADCDADAAHPPHLAVYDLSDPAAPAFVSAYDFGVWAPHEFYLWRDPAAPDRVLLWVTQLEGAPNLLVLDATDPARIVLLTTWDSFDDGGLAVARGWSSYLHSISLTDDGTIGALSHWQAGFYLVDTSGISSGLDLTVRTLTSPADRLDSRIETPQVHSAVAVPGRPLYLLTDEVYGPPIDFGCPWGFARIANVSDPTALVEVGEYRRPENDPACADGNPWGVVYSAHNPTVTENLAFVSWYAAGLVAIDLEDAAAPKTAAVFVPEPLAEVAMENPVKGGRDVGMWSYPILRDGLVYVVDSRNGLYVVRYVGPHDEEVGALPLREGNSNLHGE